MLRVCHCVPGSAPKFAPGRPAHRGFEHFGPEPSRHFRNEETIVRGFANALREQFNDGEQLRQPVFTRSKEAEDVVLLARLSAIGAAVPVEEAPQRPVRSKIGEVDRQLCGTAYPKLVHVADFADDAADG